MWPLGAHTASGVSQRLPSLSCVAVGVVIFWNHERLLVKFWRHNVLFSLWLTWWLHSWKSQCLLKTVQKYFLVGYKSGVGFRDQKAINKILTYVTVWWDIEKLYKTVFCVPGLHPLSAGTPNLHSYQKKRPYTFPKRSLGGGSPPLRTAG